MDQKCYLYTLEITFWKSMVASLTVDADVDVCSATACALVETKLSVWACIILIRVSLNRFPYHYDKIQLQGVL